MKTLLILFLLWLSGCAHKVVKTPTALTLQSFLKDQTTRTSLSRKFTGKLDLRFESKSESVSGGGRAAGGSDHHTRLELRDPLGRVQYVLAQTPEKVSIYLPTSKILYLDKADGRTYFRKTLGQSLSVSELRKIWLGVATHAQGIPLVKWHWDGQKEAFRTSGTKGKTRVELLIDGDHAAVKEMQVVTESGTYRVQYSDFEKVGEVSLAHTVDVTLENTGEKIRVEWDQLDWDFKGDVEKLSLLDLEKDTKTVTLR